MTALQNAVDAGKVDKAVAAVEWERLDDFFAEEFSLDLLRVLQSSGTLISDGRHAAKLPRLIFDADDPEAAAWASRHAAELVVEVTKTTRLAVRAAVTKAIEEKIPVLTAARQIRGLVGLTEKMQQAVDNLRAALVKDGVSDVKVQSRVDRYAKTLLDWRAENIARTEALAASNQGQREVWNQSVSAGVLDAEEYERSWIITPDDRLAVVGPRTCVLTRDGWKPISKICIGDYVLTHRDRFCQVMRAEGKWYEGPTVKIIIGCKAVQSIHLTYGHPVLVRRDGVDLWVLAENVRDTDAVFLNGVPCAMCGAAIPAGPHYPTGLSPLCHQCNVNKQNNDPRMRRSQRIAVRAFNARKWTPEARAAQAERWRGEKSPVRAALIARGRNSYGMSWGERKVAWWLRQQNISFEAQWMFRYGPKQSRGFADFYLSGPKVVIEVDGPTHRNDPDVQTKDAAKDAYLQSVGVRVLRFTDKAIREDVGNAIGDAVRAVCCIVPHSIKRLEHRGIRHNAVYHLTVEGDESFIAAGVVVHNCPRCEALDGARADLGDEFGGEGGVGPPLHPACRCVEGLLRKT